MYQIVTKILEINIRALLKTQFLVPVTCMVTPLVGMIWT